MTLCQICQINYQVISLNVPNGQIHFHNPLDNPSILPYSYTPPFFHNHTIFLPASKPDQSHFPVNVANFLAKASFSMGVIFWTEPTRKQFLEGYPQTNKLLQRRQWLQFVGKFSGCHKEVTKTFAHSFDGMEAEIRDIKLTVTESMIAKATSLPRHGEKWFRNRGIDNEDWRVFLKNPSMETTVYEKGIPISTLKSKWRNLLLVLQKFITCEGRF